LSGSQANADAAVPKSGEKNDADKAAETTRLRAAAREVYDHLNAVTGRSFRPSFKAKSSPASMLVARLREGYTVEDCKRVIDNMASAWGDDPKMADYLRPSTLFAASHFDDYLNQEPETPSYEAYDYLGDDA
jgi:uncharacterized phage protein (TIGR02220 family)